MKFRKEDGQSMVETALVLPVLIILLVGMFDFGRIFYTYTHLHLAAQEAVRVGGLGGNDSEITAFTKSYVNINDPENLVVGVSPDDSTRVSGDYVTVTLDYPMESFTPFISSLLPSAFTVHTESTIRVE
ncbi:TadE/TadG family type IV pilus assembly protein [Pontibacillus marinus]|uniref:Pilus assembly protein TadE n=1 Tax=Pontibacillus marinus BH030004 = DSM 16465 TaxID=1385511 RepID=A0A0A5FTZ9_9BACI|nr:TadE family protein [Pontibacillus marinus]KGX83389.1 pilus assembly protein TadE [Pontibacillus marinus BH030004 = DSM 16465]